MVETYAIHTSSHAERYAPFVDRYWQGIKNLNRQPDEIVLMIHETNLVRLPESVPNEYKSRTKIIETTLEHGPAMINQQIGHIESDWICFCGLDDVVFPDAYDEIDDAGEVDILVGNIRMSNGVEHRGSWDVSALKRENTLPNHSPYRRSLWERVDGWPHIRWADWGFWMKCALAGVTVRVSNNFQVWFDIGETHETDSGVLLPSEIRSQANEELRQFAHDIGFL